MRAVDIHRKIRPTKAVKKSLYLLIAGTGLITISYFFLLFAGTDRAKVLCREDGPVETFSAVCWLIATIIMFMTYFKSKTATGIYFMKTNRNIFYLLLAFFFLFCLGEEISWGQRLLGINTPEPIANINAQGEMNIHNFWIFQAYDKNLQNKTGLESWISPGKLFTLIWIVYCIMFPIMDLLSGKVHGFFNRIQLPGVPLWIGMLFLAAQAIARIFTSIDGVLVHTIVETKEAIFAFLYMTIGASFYSSIILSPVKNDTSVTS